MITTTVYCVYSQIRGKFKGMTVIEYHNTGVLRNTMDGRNVIDQEGFCKWIERKRSYISEDEMNQFKEKEI